MRFGFLLLGVRYSTLGYAISAKCLAILTPPLARGASRAPDPVLAGGGRIANQFALIQLFGTTSSKERPVFAKNTHIKNKVQRANRESDARLFSCC